jgi:outer membrane protein assembly factor BamB
LGHLRWETSIEAKIDRASSTRLVVVNASVIVGTRDGTLIALNDVNGEETWRCETFKPLHIQGMRVWEQYVVLTAASDFDAAPWVAVLALVDAMSGAVVWRHEFSATGISCPAVSCGMALFTVAVEGAHAKGFAVDLASRSIRWQVDLERNQRVAPLVADQTVWFGLGTASLNGFLIESLAPAAESSTLYIGEISRFAIAGYPNTLVVVTSDDEAYCMDTSTGQVTERLRTKGKVLHSPAFVNDSLYVN